jgi:hypothetical protein
MSRDARASLLGGIVLLSAWLTLRGIPDALTGLRRQEESVAQRAELLARAHSRIESLAELDDSIRTLDAVAEALPGMILMGSDPETASADLMRRLRDLLGRERVSLHGFEPQRDTTRSGPLRLAALTMSFETDFVELLDLIDRIGSDSALVVEALRVRAADPHADATEAERLAVELGVSAWYKPLSDETDRSAAQDRGSLP